MQLAHAEISFFPDKPPLPGGAPSKRDRSSSAEDRHEGMKVLVVDDEAIIAETLVEILIGEGYVAVAATTGAAAIALAQTFRPDIVISDVVMPDPNGVEVAIQIRDLLPECRILLLSGQTATLDLLRDARERGHDFEIVAKPIKPQLLLSLLRPKT
jgi:CheY-like chemotaxis protein